MESFRVWNRLALLQHIFRRFQDRNSSLMTRKMMYSEGKNTTEKITEFGQRLAKPGKARVRSPASSDKVLENKLGEDKVGMEMVEAVDSVAKSVGDKGQQVRSDLLEKLRQHAESTEQLKTSDTTNVSILFAGMKVESSNRIGKASSGRAMESDNGLGVMQHPRRRGTRSVDKPLSESYKATESRATRLDAISLPDMRLFEGPAVRIFKNKGSSCEIAPTSSRLFNVLEKEEVDALTSVLPVNAFEEMIHWTKEGKLWTFPIDNDQGLSEEVKVEFHEHVFLEPLLNNFPKKGPVRHFMELVAVGLSKNSYLTVQEKKNHIKWFEEYFKDKYHYFEDPATVEFCN